MKLVVRIAISEEKKTKAWVICSDSGKYNRALFLFLKNVYDGGHGVNIYRVPGGARRILKEEGEREGAFNSIRKAVENGAKVLEVMIPATRDKNHESSAATLRALRSVIGEAFPLVTINLYGIHCDGIWQLVSKEILDAQDQD